MGVQLTENAKRVLERRYLTKNEQGEVIETPENLFRRVAKNVASVDELYGQDVSKTEKEFYDMLSNLEFLPNSPTLMNADTKLQQLSACFVLPVGDSMEDIFDAIKSTALIHKSGGGTGFSFSRLRPKNDVVKSTGGIASGPVSFMRVFDAATEEIKQGGRRRGANMGILRVDHPDIMDFITSKKDPSSLTNFNISVAVTDDFMNRLRDDKEYDLINFRTKKPVDKLRARDVFDKIAEMAWRTGDPGLVFIDRINEDNPVPEVGEIESTNPCGEQPLLPFESCNLGSINLKKMLKQSDEMYEIDWDKLAKTVRKAVHFLDNVVDVNAYPLPEIAEMTKANRKIGLGVMGFADMLIQLGIPYDSEEALSIASNLMGFISKESEKATKGLAEMRGPFPNFDRSIYAGQEARRNATTTTIAPTGSLSIIAGCSSGIEPIFAVSFVRKILGGEEIIEVNPIFEELAKQRGFYSEGLMKKIATRGSVQNIPEVHDDIKRIFVTALDIDPEWHVRMQAAFQKHVENATSKTINFPKDATVEDVKEAYLLAYELGCKGITIYRYGSKEEQVLSLREEEETTKIKPRPRPKVISGSTTKQRTGCGNLYVTVNEDKQGPFEVFAQLGKAGGCAASQTEAISRLVSLALRSGIDIDDITKQLKAIRCPAPFLGKDGIILSCPDAIAQALELWAGKKEMAKEEKTLDDFEEEEKVEMNIMGVCPDCGNVLASDGGCTVCGFCGYSRCG